MSKTYTFNITLECEPVKAESREFIEVAINDFLDAIGKIDHPVIKWENVDWAYVHTTAEEQ